MNIFEERFKKLNKEQKKAVTETEGPVMVIAGPGTGKTEILGMRTAYITKKLGVSAESILITTFTESGVTAIKKRLLQIMGTDAYKVNITTLHGFCASVINEFPEKFIFAKNISQISDIERIDIIRNIIDSLELKKLVSFGDRYFYVNDILKKIQELKREDVTPENLNKHLTILETELENEHSINPRTKKPPIKWQDKEKLILKNKELSKIYEKYQKTLKEKGLYDYEDMILFVVNKLKEDDELLANYQERFLYIMLDEYQDTNRSQNEIISLLTSFFSDQEPNILVVGDDDQSIYRFQGASLENILLFSENYKIKKPIVLKENYRSTQNILDASFSMISENKNRIGNFIESVDKKLSSQKKGGEKIELIKLSSEDAEKFYIFKKIEKLLEKKINPNDIAIFSRTNSQSHEIAEFLIKRKIPVIFDASNNILEGKSVMMFLDYLSVILNPYDDAKLLKLMSYGFFNINIIDIYKLSRYITHLRFKNGDEVGLYDVLSNAQKLNELELSSKEEITIFLEKLSEFKRADSEMMFTTFCEKVFKESGFLNWVYQKEEKIDYLRHISTLFSEIKELNKDDLEMNIEKFLKRMEIYKEYGIQIKEDAFILEKDGVRVMTAHRSKGLEFEYVFITKTIDKNWGNRRVMDKIKLPENLLDASLKLSIEKNEDERRLFFVALTRAKKYAYLTHAQEYGKNETKKEAVVSQFVEEIDKKYKNEITKENDEKDLKEFLDKKLKESEVQKTEENDFLKSILKDYKLSITNLETYLQCPKKFKYKHLIRIPEAKNKHMAMGTAYHKALERFFLEFKNSEKLPKPKLLTSAYKTALKKEILIKRDFDELEDIGVLGLKGYLEKYKDEIKIPEAVEYNFSNHEVFLEDAHLTGKIDKIEKINDTNDVKVIDYKTGGIKSDNEIAGNTKNSDGRLKRQIVFYKILCDLDEKFKYTMIQGELDFVQGRDGKYKKALVSFSDDDVSELKEKIIDVYEKIMNLKFECTSDEGHCDECKEYK
jgi:DNA helicase-2/ATP-dependent DNA helicase PcrA